MRPFIFVLLLFLIVSIVQAKEIEVIVGGKSYYSVDSYKAAKRGVVSPQEALPEKWDPQTEKAFKALKSVSSEDSVGHVKADFDQNWDNPSPKFNITSEELEQRLEAVADNRKEPVLVVSDNGKLRVMLLDEDKTTSALPENPNKIKP